jgi:hypothetical protein
MNPKITLTDIEIFRIKFIDDPIRKVVLEDNQAHVTIDNPNAKK